jgi:hypothetical protein
MDLKATYNKIANDWFNDHDESVWWQEWTLRFLNLLKKGDRVLDVVLNRSILLNKALM